MKRDVPAFGPFITPTGSFTFSFERPAAQTATATEDDPRRAATRDRMERARLILELIDARRRLYNDPNLDRYWERQVLAEMEREIDETPRSSFEELFGGFFGGRL